MSAEIVLATSAARPEYARDFLTCIASPAEHLVAFSFKRDWFAPEVLGPSLVGRRAVIVFCEPDGPEFDFLAIRHVQIEQLTPADPTRVRGPTPITIAFRLRDFVAVDDADLPVLRESWNDSLRGVQHRPRPSRDAGDPTTRFVFEHERLDESRGEVDPERSWRLLSEALGDCGSLEKAFFFRVGELRRATGGRDLTTTQVGSLRRVYQLDPSTEYELPMAAYSKSGETPYSEAIAPTTSSEQLLVQAVTQSSAGRASEAVLVLRTGEVKRAQVATLIIHGAEKFEHQVPRVEIATRIKPNLVLAAVLMAAIALGVVLGGLPKDALGLTDVPLVVIKVLGGLLVGVATLAAVGRVAGVGK